MSRPFFLRRRLAAAASIDSARFWIALEQGVACVLSSMKITRGGEIFPPR
ncbi:hypothetical protein [Dongia sp.]